MRQHDETIFETIGKLDDVIEVEMSVPGRALLMTIGHERTLNHQDLGLKKRAMGLEHAAIRIAGVEEERLPVISDDIDAAPAKIADIVTSSELRAKSMTNLQKFIASRGNSMRGSMCAHFMPFAKGNNLLIVEPHDVDVIVSPLELFMQRHQSTEIVRHFAGNENPPAGDALQVTLPGVEGNAQRVVEMPVSDENFRHANGQIGTPADVQHDPQFANPKICFLSGARSPFDGEVLGGKGEEIFIDGHCGGV